MLSNHIKWAGVCAVLSACSVQSAEPPTSIAGIEKAFGVKICDGSKIGLVTKSLSPVGAISPIYEISFPSQPCEDTFLESLKNGSTYEHPFGDKDQLLGSSQSRAIQFLTEKTGDRILIFHVSDTSWLAKRRTPK